MLLACTSFFIHYHRINIVSGRLILLKISWLQILKQIEFEQDISGNWTVYLESYKPFENILIWDQILHQVRFFAKNWVIFLLFIDSFKLHFDRSDHYNVRNESKFEYKLKYCHSSVCFFCLFLQKCQSSFIDCKAKVSRYSEKCGSFICILCFKLKL